MIPKYDEIMLPFLRLLSDGQEHSLSEVFRSLVDHFQLSDEEVRELLPSGKQGVFRSRVGWARTYLSKAGLINAPQRARYVITERGIDFLKQNPGKITKDCLRKYDEFIEFVTPNDLNDNSENSILNADTSNQTPQELLEDSYQTIHTELSNELLNKVKTGTPEFFERLVVDLLIAMGYGGSRKDAGKALGKSGDGGVDGIINEDRLGLDVIYLQAKRWENSVPVSSIRDFTGALASKKAKKGVFITTSTFPRSAYEFVSQVDYKIILIDGQKLVDLMIEHNVGTSVVDQYLIKSIDLDYFEE